jgi:NAD(P)-dependent dehydrogenase (short-subunit alcohol dehydrogenase family)
MDQPLKGAVAVVTGASHGLGLHFAQVLAGAGASVALMARRTAAIKKAAAEIEKAGGKARAFTLDVSDAYAIAPALDAAQEALGPLSIMVNNAGVGGEGMALALPIEEWDATFAVNVRAVFVGAREAARRMLDNGVADGGRGRIINIASIGAHTVLPGLAAYCASKAAVAQMTRALAREWARYDIAVNALCPGYIETGINSEWFTSEGGQKQIKGFPRRRLMDAEDLDAARLMLAGPGARHITGSVLTLDDGQSL